MSRPLSQPPVVVGLGEVLWDIFPDGPRFGGAPANYACSVAALSDDIEVFMVSGVGQDELGRQAQLEFQQRRVNVAALQEHPQQTGIVNVSLDQAGAASYEFAEDAAWDNLQWTNDLQNLAERTDAVCFGTLGQRSPASAETIRNFVRNVDAGARKIFDINLRPPYYTTENVQASLAMCNCLKLNDEELALVAELAGISGSLQDLLPRFAETWDLNTVALTLGANGAMLYSDGQFVETPGIDTRVQDTVGAGDAFTAALTVGLLNEMVLQEICDHACALAAYVCSQPGATPTIPVELSLP